MNARWLLALLTTCALALSSAACSGDASNNATRPTSTAPIETPPDRGAYLALGDSLSFGIGASDPATKGFVALIHQALGDGYELINIGVPGHTSQDLIDSQLANAISQIEQRAGDGNPNNDVRLITLEIGGNDLLRLNAQLLVSGICPDPDTALSKPECYEPLADVFAKYETNLTQVLNTLRSAAPDVPVIVLTLYNPLEILGARGQVADLALEGLPGTRFEEGMNDITSRIAHEDDGIVLVDLYPVFRGRSTALISPDFIHPNDAGYQAMAKAVLTALTPQAELP